MQDEQSVVIWVGGNDSMHIDRSKAQRISFPAEDGTSTNSIYTLLCKFFDCAADANHIYQHILVSSITSLGLLTCIISPNNTSPWVTVSLEILIMMMLMALSSSCSLLRSHLEPLRVHTCFDTLSHTKIDPNNRLDAQYSRNSQHYSSTCFSPRVNAGRGRIKIQVMNPHAFEIKIKTEQNAQGYVAPIRLYCLSGKQNPRLTPNPGVWT